MEEIYENFKKIYDCKEQWNRWFVGDSRTLYYCVGIVCGNERQFDHFYHVHREFHAGKSNRNFGYQQNLIGNEKVNKKSNGNILDFLTVGIAVLAIAILVLASFQTMGLMVRKLEVSQIARKYILSMETKGCLTEPDRAALTAELESAGLYQVELTGTTLQPVEYGEEILLCIRGYVRGGAAAGSNIWSEGFKVKEYHVEEKRMSTAKN